MTSRKFDFKITPPTPFPGPFGVTEADIDGNDFQFPTIALSPRADAKSTPLNPWTSIFLVL